MTTQVSHGEIIVGRLRHLLVGVQAAEAQSVNWPKELVRAFVGMSDDQVSAIRVVAHEVQRAAEKFQQ